MNQNKAFTLVERSIVLLIIGLIVGAITAGSSLINQAAFRSVMSDFDQYRTAINAFKIQYDALPGDMSKSNSFWQSVTSGNGNGTI